MDITREGVWKNPVLLKILSQQPVETEEGKSVFLEMMCGCSEITWGSFGGKAVV